MKMPIGKGVFLNNLRLQTAADWAAKCQAIGARRVMLKVDAAMNNGRLGPVAQALDAKGITVEAWQFINPANPAASAHVATRDCAIIELAISKCVAAFHVDAEGPYNLPSNLDDQAARIYLRELRAGLAMDVPIGLCSYRYPSYQPNFPWLTFLLGSDFHGPQCYWVGSHNPGYQLRKSIAELQAIKKMPVVPVGAAYSEHGWKSAASEVEEFMDAALDAGCPAVSLWCGDEMFSRRAFDFRGSTYADRDAWCAAFKAAWPEAPAPGLPLFLDLPEVERWAVVQRMGQKVGVLDPRGYPIA